MYLSVQFEFVFVYSLLAEDQRQELVEGDVLLYSCNYVLGFLKNYLFCTFILRRNSTDPPALTAFNSLGDADI